MASSQSIVDLIADNMKNAGIITSKKMFGEYAIYCNGKVLGFICDNMLFLKPTQEAKEFFPEFTEGQAYPGSKMYMVIPEDKWEDPDFMTELAVISYNALPASKPKTKKKA